MIIIERYQSIADYDNRFGISFTLKEHSPAIFEQHEDVVGTDEKFKNALNF